VSFIEPKKIEKVLRDADWVNAMHEELNNFIRNQVWELVERPKNHNVIGVAEPPDLMPSTKYLSSIRP
jgi:rRNA pseudouridine-1189 N-methylase Emg1 (Nep1/Mra1 family)